MFKSQLTGKRSEKHESPVKVVTEVREVTYVNHKGTVSKGFEIVKELSIKQSELGLVKPTITHKSDKMVVQKRRVEDASKQKASRQGSERD